MLAVVGGKGGVGKTTTALGLGVVLAARRRRPLVVDADADMPDLAVATGVPVSPGVDALAEGASVERAAHATARWPGVSVVPAEPGAAVGDALDALPRDRPVVLDCPGGAGPDATTPLRAADRALVVTTPDRRAVADALKTVATADALGTPVAGVAVSCSPTVPDGLAERAGTAVSTAIPAADSPPLGDADVRAAYRQLAGAIDPGRV